MITAFRYTKCIYAQASTPFCVQYCRLRLRYKMLQFIDGNCTLHMLSAKCWRISEFTSCDWPPGQHDRYLYFEFLLATISTETHCSGSAVHIRMIACTKNRQYNLVYMIHA